jgi:4-amino-4-deoxy-L-arabinose transferase-like glycosyltransferase
MKFFRKENFILLIIFLIALFLRLYKLGELPYSLHGDEIMNGYVGRFILENGYDLYGNRWPLIYFDRFGDYPNVIPMYISGLSTYIFGVNEFAVRFPVAIMGALTIFPVYYLALKIFDKKEVSQFAAFLLAILPWHLVLSRATAEGILALGCFCFALLWLVKSIEEGNKKLFCLASLAFLLTYFLYPAFRLLTPLSLMLIALLLVVNKKKRHISVVFLAVFFLIFTLAVSQTVWFQGRFRQTSLLHSEEVSARLKANLEALSYDLGPNSILRARIFHNKLVAYGREFLSQYLSYFSPEFLFMKGGLPDRYVVPYQGLFFISLFIFLIAGLIPVAIKINSYLFNYFLYLCLIAPLPAALTIDDVPNSHRAIMLILPLIMIFSYGYLKYNRQFKKFRATFLVLVLILLEFIYFWNQYSLHTASYKSVLRNDGCKQLARYLKENKDSFDNIFMPSLGTLPIYYLFYTNNFDPSYAGRFALDFKIDNIEKINFIENWCPSAVIKDDQFKKDVLIVDQGDCEIKTGLKEIEVIYRKDSTKAFRLLVPGSI